MSDMYAIKGSTLTAIGDAVRSKSVKYNTFDDITNREPIYSITVDVSQINWKGSNNDLNYQYDLDFRTLLDDKYDLTKKFYCKFDYETNDEKIFYVYIRNSFQKDTTFMSPYIDTPITETYFTYDRNISYKLQLNGRQKDLDDGKTLIFTLRLWPCDANDKFIGLNTMTPLQMAETIDGLMTIPDKAFTITGDCGYMFGNKSWGWFIESARDKIITKDITNTNNMFRYLEIDSIPFDINISKSISDMSYTFQGCKIKSVPYIIGPERTPPTGAYSGAINLDSLFYSLSNLRHIPEDYFWKMVPNKDFWETQANLSYNGQGNLFYNCHSLRELPDISMIGGNWTSSYSCVYYQLLCFCYSLNKATNIPVYGTFSSNVMNDIFYSNYRLKDFTFATNEDGTPKTANWKNQTLSFTDKAAVGYGPTQYYNSGITADKEVKDDATYQALKDDPDWFTRDINYSRYNHDSAVNTINSLPDCSATGTNTIKFRGNAGALTDGGAINTLTEAEIAVAAAKGWTVSLV